jgi:hypothetical protein
LNKVKIRYVDAFTKNDLYLNLNHLQTQIKTFDLTKMNFDVPRFKIDGMQFSYRQGIAQNNSETKSAKSKSPDLKLKLGTIDLSKIKVDYQDEKSKLATNMILDKLLVKVNNFDLNKNIIDLDKLELVNANAALKMGKEDKKENGKSTSSKSNDWKIKVSELAFEKVNFNYDDDSHAPIQKGMDYQHLKVQSLNLDADDLAYDSQVVSGKINSMTANEKSGFKLESFKTDFYYGKQSAFMKNLYLKTPQTIVRNKIEIAYPSIQALKENPGVLNIKANLNQSKIGFSDILLFGIIKTKSVQ